MNEFMVKSILNYIRKVRFPRRPAAEKVITMVSNEHGQYLKKRRIAQLEQYSYETRRMCRRKKVNRCGLKWQGGYKKNQNKQKKT